MLEIQDKVRITTYKEELRVFCNKYCSFQVSNSKESFGNQRFTKFPLMISDMIDQLTIRELQSDADKKVRKRIILKIVSKLMDYINTGDLLLDTYYQEKNPENFKSFMKSLAQFAIIPWEIQKLCKKINLDINSKMLNLLPKMKDLIKMEKKLINNPSGSSENEFFDFLVDRNCDFLLYYSLLTPFIKEEYDIAIKEFLQHYVIIDILLDDITDLFSDFSYKSFNSLLFFLKKKQENSECYNKQSLILALIDQGIFQKIFKYAMRSSNLALKSIEGLDGPLFNYLRFLVNGEREGLLLFRKNDYFIDFIQDTMKYEQMCLLVLKPHPWCEISYDEVMT